MEELAAKVAYKARQHEHMVDNFGITMAHVSEKIIVARAEQQLDIESSIRLLERDVSRASRLGKSRIDTLSDLERRINMMRHQLREPGNVSVDEEVRREVNVSNKSKVEKLFTVCTRCQRKILVQLFVAHSSACQKMPTLTEDAREEREPVYSIDQSVHVSLATFKPQPPRNFKVISKGCSFIHWEWEPPIIDGGLAVTDYEISCTVKYMIMNNKTGKYMHYRIEQPLLRTTQWCLNDPICHTGYKMVCLRAGSEYVDFKIRSYNLRGCSDWAIMTYEPVKTEEAEAPGSPLFMKSHLVTSSCLHLTWDAPYYDGGLEIIDYIVFCTVQEVHQTVTGYDVIIPKQMKLNVGPVKSVVVRNVQPNTEVIKIHVKCVNFAGLTSEACDLGTTLRTLECSRHALISRELASASRLKTEFVDSSFFAGVQQRLFRADFIKRLNYELTKTPPDELEVQEAQEWAAVKQDLVDKKLAAEAEAKAELDLLAALNGDDEDDDKEHQSCVESVKTNPDGSIKITKIFSFSHIQRRHHFKHKIKKQEALIKSLKEERYIIDTERTRLTTLMKARQKRQMLLKLERDRLSTYKGGQVTSSVLHGHDMQYELEDFFKSIEKAMEICQGEVAQAKFQIMIGEKRKEKIKTQKEKAEAFLKDRHASFLDFNITQQKLLHTMDKFQHRDQDDRIMKKYFTYIVNFIEGRKNMRVLIQDVFVSLIYRYKRSAFQKWHLGNFYQSASETEYFSGAGSCLLQKAFEKRKELQTLLRETMACTADLQQKMVIASMPRDSRHKLLASAHIKSMDEGVSHSGQETRGMHYLYEGDGYASIGKFQRGYDMYETQILFLRSRPILDIKMLAICHGRLGKMCLNQGKHDRAIVEFDRQLSLGKEIKDPVEVAEAYYGMGEGYQRVKDYDSAIRYLDIAQSRLVALGNMPKYCGAMRALRECYTRQDKQEEAGMYTEKINKIEGELISKLSYVHERLNDMKSRLSNTTAGIEHVVRMERTTYKALQLRNLIHKKSDEQNDLQELINKQVAAAEAIQAILEAIQKETDAAYETDELEMWSYLVHDNAQIIDVEELKTRLHARKLKELDNYKREKDEESKLEKQMRNLEDDLQAADQQMELEEGALMRHIRHDKPFRCVGLCRANAAGNEVTGTATGGFEHFICAEGYNVHLLDFHTGELQHVFIGDDKNRLGATVGHTAVVTCLVHDGSMIFSGSADETIMSWSSNTLERLNVMTGHEGSVVTMAVDGPYLVSSGADITMRLWDKVSGVQLRVIHGHSKSVLAIDLGPSWMVTGSADEEVRVWTLTQKSKHTIAVESTHRLSGHDCSITCVRYGKLEVMSGDIQGRIFIWWMATGEVLRQCKVHDGPVRSMQFDAIHIVSGGVDCVVAITDVATGEVLQSLRGHEGHVLAVAFDTERIVSAGGDNTLRYWSWGKKLAAEDKVHVLDKGQTLLGVTKLYSDLTVADLMKWNGIVDLRNCFEGMKLIVRKGDPTALTDAEKVAEERDRRREAGLSLVSSKFKTKAANETTRIKYNRVHRTATDMDFHSLGNRMFSKAKKDNELFPDAMDPDKDLKSLSSRLQRNMSTPASGLIGARPRYYISNENTEEWGHIADAVGVAMIVMFIEYDCYELIIEMKRANRDSRSVIGRMYSTQKTMGMQINEENAKRVKVKGMSRSASSRSGHDSGTSDDDTASVSSYAGSSLAENEALRLKKRSERREVRRQKKKQLALEQGQGQEQDDPSNDILQSNTIEPSQQSMSLSLRGSTVSVKDLHSIAECDEEDITIRLPHPPVISRANSTSSQHNTLKLPAIDSHKHVVN